MQLFVSAAATLPSRAIPYVVAKAAMLSTDGSKVTMAGLVLFGSGVKDMWLDDDEITRISRGGAFPVLSPISAGVHNFFAPPLTAASSCQTPREDSTLVCSYCRFPSPTRGLYLILCSCRSCFRSATSNTMVGIIAARTETFITTMQNYHYLGITGSATSHLHASCCSPSFSVVSEG
jgi:hypothetical protein